MGEDDERGRRPGLGQDRLLRLRRPPDADLDGAAGGDRAAPLALARAGAETADGARLRPRPRAAGRRRRLLPGGAAPARHVRPLRGPELPQDLGLEGDAGLRSPQQQKGQLREDQTVRQSDRPAAGKADPGPGRLEDEKGRTRGQGLRRLVPEPPEQNDDRRLLAARARTPDRLDPGQLGGGRGGSGLGDGSKLVFEAGDVLERIEEHGDLFAPVLELEQELPEL